MAKKSIHRAFRVGEAVNELMEAEYIMSQLQSSAVVHTLRPKQTRQFEIVLNLLRDLIHDLEQDNAQEQLAS